MKASMMVTLATGVVLLQGCSFSMPYSSDQTAVTDNATYDDSYTPDPNVTRTRQGHNEDEVPVQMTKHDADMHAVAPEPKTSHAPTSTNHNQNVLLPISSGDLE